MDRRLEFLNFEDRLALDPANATFRFVQYRYGVQIANEYIDDDEARVLVGSKGSAAEYKIKGKDEPGDNDLASKVKKYVGNQNTHTISTYIFQVYRMVSFL
ncbi:MAG: hypothetical protein M1820_003493 [Bogoriella megaspora]|nr:MAG: hypothetical protein M1820_003493 [Bogoriella megaspora]